MSNILDKYCKPAPKYAELPEVGNIEDLEAYEISSWNHFKRYVYASIIDLLFFGVWKESVPYAFFGVLFVILVSILSKYAIPPNKFVNPIIIRNKKTGKIIMVSSNKISCKVTDEGKRMIYASDSMEISEKDFRMYTGKVTKKTYYGTVVLLLVVSGIAIASFFYMPVMKSENGWYLPYTTNGGVAYVVGDHMYILQKYTIYQDLYTKMGPFVYQKYTLSFKVPVVTINDTPRTIRIKNVDNCHVVTIKNSNIITKYRIDGENFTPAGHSVLMLHNESTIAFAVLYILFFAIVLAYVPERQLDRVTLLLVATVLTAAFVSGAVLIL